MPGRKPRNNELKLCSKQQAIARKVLSPAFDPSREISQWSGEKKQQLVATINAQFGAGGFPPVYTVRKLDDWISNAKYRATCKQRQAHPSCWTSESRSKARAKARETKRAQHRTQASRANRMGGAGGLPSHEQQQVPVEQLRQVHYGHVGNAATGKAEHSWFDGCGRSGTVFDGALVAAKGRAEEFASIRRRFEADGYGRTDAFASHRGLETSATSPMEPSLSTTGTVTATTTAVEVRDDGHSGSGSSTYRPGAGISGTTEDSKLVPTFMAFAGFEQPAAAQQAAQPFGFGSHSNSKQPRVFGVPLEEDEEQEGDMAAMTDDCDFDSLPDSGWHPQTDISALEAALSPAVRTTHNSKPEAAALGDGDDGAGPMLRSLSGASSADEMDDSNLFEFGQASSSSFGGAQQHSNNQRQQQQQQQLPPSGPEWELFLERNIDSLPAFELPRSAPADPWRHQALSHFTGAMIA